MTVQNKIDLKLRLPFEAAGVEFVIHVDETDDGTTFRLMVEGLSSGDRVPFTSAASPVLADWMRGIHQVAVQSQGLGQVRRKLDLRHVRARPHGRADPRGPPTSLRHDQAEVRALHGISPARVARRGGWRLPAQVWAVGGCRLGFGRFGRLRAVRQALRIGPLAKPLPCSGGTDPCLCA